MINNEKEVIEYLKDWNKDLALFDDEKEGIHVHEICINALEKQINNKKKVEVQKWTDTKCPGCGRVLSTSHPDGYYSLKHKPKYCEDCGTELVW